MENHEQQQSQPASELPDDVADAWAAVLIDVYEKRKSTKANEDDASQTKTADQKDGDDAQPS